MVTILTELTKLVLDVSRMSYIVVSMSGTRSEWLRLLCQYGDHYSSVVTKCCSVMDNDSPAWPISLVMYFEPTKQQVSACCGYKVKPI